MPDKLPTTVIGSFPKPDYLPIRDWFDSARDRGTMNAPEVSKAIRPTACQPPMKRCSCALPKR